MEIGFDGVLAKGTIVAGPGKKWLLGCGLGCGIPILLSILLSVGGAVFMMKPFNRAIDAQKDLTAAHGARADYIPPEAGLAGDRLEKFINVRRALIPMCENFTEIGEKFQQMDDLDKNGEEPSKGEIFGAVGNVMGAVFGIAGNIGRFTEIRNTALLTEGMGLGEYIWIYTLVYNSWLGYPPNTDFDDSGPARGTYGSDDQKLIRQLMANYVTVLQEAGRSDEAALWQTEIGRLKRTDGTGVPWAEDEMPALLVKNLVPYQGELDELFCAATSAFEFSKVRKSGMTITTD